MFAIPYLLELATALRFSSTIKRAIDFISIGSILSSSIEQFHSSIDEDEKQRVELSHSNIDEIVLSKPVVQDTISISSNPVNFQDYLRQNNELLMSLNEQFKNNSLQSEFSNILSVESLKSIAKTSEHLDTLTTILNTALPAMVIQFQDIAKISGVLSVNKDIDIAYNELALTNHETLISTLQNLQLSLNGDITAPAVNVVNEVAVPVVNVSNEVAVPAVNVVNEVAVPVVNVSNEVAVPVVNVSNEVAVPAVNVVNEVAVPAVNVTNDVAVPVVNITNEVSSGDSGSLDNSALVESSNLQAVHLENISLHLANVSENSIAQKKVAEHLTTVAQITRLDGSIYAELTPLELSNHKDISISEAKIKEKEISDYQTTERGIFNLDGNVVTTMKPIELASVKDAVIAKNNTDEMEFELDDDILDFAFSPLPLPSFSNYNYDLEQKYTFKGDSFNG